VLAFVPFQVLLNSIGWILAKLYDVVGSFGISIIMLTLLIRFVLLPLGIKQIKSMQAMSAIQPKVKELQKKYKGNKAKQQEETMKLYKDAGVNPLGGCLPVLLQFPLLIAMYAVIRPPILVPVTSANVEISSLTTIASPWTATTPAAGATFTTGAVTASVLPTPFTVTVGDEHVSISSTDGTTWTVGERGVDGTTAVAHAAKAPIAEAPAYYLVHNSHIPATSQLYRDILTHQTGSFLGMNLQCSPIQAGGGDVPTKNSQRADLIGGLQIGPPGTSFRPGTDGGTIACGSGPLSRAPYYLFLLAMILTTFYQQRQMQKASPPGAQTGSQQTIMKIMPVMFGIFGLQFAAGLLVYWTTANLWQIGQQFALLKLGHIGPDALDRRLAEQRAKGDQPVKQGFMSKLMAQAEAQRADRDQQAGKARPAASKGTTPRPKGGQSSKNRSSGNRSSGTRSTGATPTPKRRPNPGTPKPPTKKKPGGSS
jgi:YidC/Oxa1 family membrane protein insertase